MKAGQPSVDVQARSERVATVDRVLGLAMAAALLVGFGPWVFFADAGWGSLFLSVGAALAGLGLLLALLVLGVIRARQGRLGAAARWLWLPALAAGLLLLGGLAWSDARRNAFDAAHPIIGEVHINLSGRTLHLPPQSRTMGSLGSLPGDQPARFLVVTRYPIPDEPPLVAYQGAQLAASFTTLDVRFGDTEDTAQVQTLPVVQNTRYPDVSDVLPGRSASGSNNAAGTRRFLYHYYPDRVEVAPALRLSGTEMMELRGRKTPVSAFYLANLHSQPIARLEIDGQAVDLGERAVPENDSSGGCGHRLHAVHAINPLRAALSVRWQFAETNPRWHEARVQVPAFRSGDADLPGTYLGTAITFYFDRDGRVVAERSEERSVDQSQHRIVLRTTGPGERLSSAPACGTARDQYQAEVRVIQD